MATDKMHGKFREMRTYAICECLRSRRQRHAEVWSRARQSTARRAALAGRSPAGAVQTLCNGSPMSAAQGASVHDGLLHPHLRHCSSAAPAVRWLPSAVRDIGVRCSVVGPSFSVAGLAAWNSSPDYLRDPTRSFDSFRFVVLWKLFFSRSTSVHGALEALQLCAI